MLVIVQILSMLPHRNIWCLMTRDVMFVNINDDMERYKVNDEERSI